MDTSSYDLIVIGAGPVGENVADRAVAGGLTAVIVESELVGGECSYWACTPSKALLRPIAALRGARDVDGAKQAVTGGLDVAAVLRRRDHAVPTVEVGLDTDVLQARSREQRGHRLPLGRPDLDQKPPARHQPRPGAARDGAIGVQPVAAGGQRLVRLPVAHLGGKRGHLARRDVGRVRDDQVEAAGDAGKPVRAQEAGTPLQPEVA